jgi:sortase A
MRARGRTFLALGLAVAAGVSVGDAAWIWGKARLAQVLLAVAWQQARAGEGAARPWPWADTWPVARLDAPGGESLLVLAGASGRTLAFGPGHVTGTALPGTAGNAVLVGHRDTHFALLRRLAPGERLVVERPDGVRLAYRVVETTIVDERDLTPLAAAVRPTLTLVTCWPFDALVPGGPLRYVVRAEAPEAVETARRSRTLPKGRRRSAATS